MDISKHIILDEISEAMGMVEKMGCSTELTDLSIKLGDIAVMAKCLVDGEEINRQ